MGASTGIAWTRSSWSPWIGCTRVSPGCDHCYAEALDKRHRYGGATHWGPGVRRHRTSASYWRQPLKWNRLAEMELAGSLHQDGWQGAPGFWPVFPSLCDPFDNEVPDQWRQDFWRLVRDTPNLTWLLLTKRIGNARSMMDGHYFPNVWLGASIVNQDELDRDGPKLLAISAAKRFISYEPALGRVDFCETFGMWWNQTMNCFESTGSMFNRRGCEGLAKPGIDQVIVGGESSQGGKLARPFNIEWARSTVRQCRAAGVAVFVKQLGSEPTWHRMEDTRDSGLRGLKDRAGADPAEWPEDLRVQEFPSTQREEACR